MANQAQALMVLHRAIEANRPIDVPFHTEKAAKSFRFMLYSARKRKRKEGADYHGIPLDQYKSDFDKLHFGIEELDDGRWAVRIQQVMQLDLEIIDSHTGEQLELNFRSTAEETDDTIPLGPPEIKPEDLQ